MFESTTYDVTDTFESRVIVQILPTTYTCVLFTNFLIFNSIIIELYTKTHLMQQKSEQMHPKFAIYLKVMQKGDMTIVLKHC